MSRQSLSFPAWPSGGTHRDPDTEQVPDRYGSDGEKDDASGDEQVSHRVALLDASRALLKRSGRVCTYSRHVVDGSR